MKRPPPCPTCGRGVRAPQARHVATAMLRSGLDAVKKDGSPDWHTRLMAEQRLSDMYGWRQRQKSHKRGKGKILRASQPGERGSAVAAPSWLAAAPLPLPNPDYAATPPVASPGSVDPNL